MESPLLRDGGITSPQSHGLTFGPVAGWVVHSQSRPCLCKHGDSQRCGPAMRSLRARKTAWNAGGATVRL